jgi:hypothetical protein
VIGGEVSASSEYAPSVDGPITSGEGHVDLLVTSISTPSEPSQAWLTIHLLVQQDSKYYISDDSVAATMICNGGCSTSGVTLDVTDRILRGRHQLRRRRGRPGLRPDLPAVRRAARTLRALLRRDGEVPVGAGRSRRAGVTCLGRSV